MCSKEGPKLDEECCGAERSSRLERMRSVAKRAFG